MIRISNVSFSYDGMALLDGLTFHAAKGERWAITAPSGAGKTTLFRLISGLEHPSGGSISVNGRVSCVFQESRLIPWLNVRDNIRIVNDSLGEEKLGEMLRAAGLEEAALKRPNELSGGMRRRAAVLRALAFPHDILLLDEPFSGIDRELREKLSEYILRSEQGKTLLLISHDAGDAQLLNCRGVSLSTLMLPEKSENSQS